MSSRILFMGEQEDPELDVWLGRGTVRIYEAKREPEPPPRPEWRSLAGGCNHLFIPGADLSVCGDFAAERCGTPEDPAARTLTGERHRCLACIRGMP